MIVTFVYYSLFRVHYDKILIYFHVILLLIVKQVKPFQYSYNTADGLNFQEYFVYYVGGFTIVFVHIYPFCASDL